MKLNKLKVSKSKCTSKLDFVKKCGAKTSSFKHQFRVIPADDINSNRSSAYSYLTF